jgi:hypothetical protein
MRLWWPTVAYLGVNAASSAAGVAPANIALVGQMVTRQLWFLPVYLVMIALTPVMLAVAVPHLTVLGMPTTCWCGVRSTSGASPGATGC